MTLFCTHSMVQLRVMTRWSKCICAGVRETGAPREKPTMTSHSSDQLVHTNWSISSTSATEKPGKVDMSSLTLRRSLRRGGLKASSSGTARLHFLLHNSFRRKAAATFLSNSG